MELKHYVPCVFVLLCISLTGSARRRADRLVFRGADDDDDDEPRIFNYNLYLERPHTTRVDSKDKVETLGAVLKGHIHKLKETTNKKIDIVFLVDASTSVGPNNFREEIKFVKKLLSDFTVDSDHTRVSVITYSSSDRVIRHVDYLDDSGKDRHKCALLEHDLNKIEYTGGGTYTLGAFLEAKTVFKNARESASKAIFLVTDGFSNGGDPRPLANILKRQGVKIFTFGIRNGNVRELFDMASEPKNESCYILGSFEEFEALARRALHEDLTVGKYIRQPLKKCNRLCVGKDCCDDRATCNCGSHTGKYECMCPPGYYGNGLKGGCQACPSGTYKSDRTIGDVFTCTKCPDENHVTQIAATSAQQCVCRKGYRNFNGTGCAVLKCPSLTMPKNGYFVNDKCKSVFNAACGLRCKPGFELRGSSLRICREDGTWSGTDTECIMKTCPALMIPKNGNMICTTDDFTFNTVCRFTCDTGYKLVGSRKRTCLAIAFWTGINTRCREITCQPLTDVRDGSIYPPSCTAGEVAFGTTCSITCHPGYTLIGPHSRQCQPEGLWTPSSEPNQCVDTSPPFIMCPYNMEAETDLNEDTSTVSWQVPLAVDNSGYVPSLASVPAVMPPAKFPIGTTKVTYVAEDLNKNQADCQFYINVRDKQKPTIDRCFSPLPTVSPEPYATVIWEEPLFSDNSGEEVRVQRSHSPGLFPKGRTAVTYTAFDKSGNNNTCTIKINVIPHPCEYPTMPLNGNRTCYEDIEGVVCKFTCNEGYHFAIPPAPEYRCAFDNIWEPSDLMPVSDCSALQLAHDIVQPASFTFAGLIACQQRLELKRLEKDFEQKVTKRVRELCEEGVNCAVRDLTTTCTQADDLSVRIVLGRDKRSVDTGAEELNLRTRREAEPITETAVLSDGSIITFTYLLSGSVNQSQGTVDEPPPVIDQAKLLNTVENIMKSIQKDAKKGDFDLEVNGQRVELTDIKFEENPIFVCEPGSVSLDNSCMECPVGTFFNIVTEQCESCRVGTFQPQRGQLTCLYCPHNTSTPNAHATSQDDCRALCLPGTFSYNGLEMCETCRRGYYQPKYGQIECDKCPKQFTTLRRGSLTEESCREKCDPGYVSKSGLKPCWPCPRGYYQSKGGKSSCMQCPAGATTLNVGTGDISDCELELSDDPYQAHKPIDLVGQEQEIFVNECFEEPCLNGATCVSELFGFDCICAPGYAGIFCEESVDECEGNPCLHDGTCVDRVADFVCQCKSGFKGKKCEINIDDCLGAPCQHGGTCIDGVDTYICDCVNGFTGQKCETNINDCAADTCLNGGKCLDEIAGYTCKCPLGITGKNCEIDEDNCASGPCQNDATCVDGAGKFTCICPDGFKGPTCDVDIDECSPNPCSPKATCEDLPGAYFCHCPTGFTGKDCSSEIDVFFQMDFPATATTTDYAKVKVSKDMTSATACFWIKTTDTENQGTPFSYANEDGDNIFTVSDYDGFVFYVNGEKITTTVKANDGVWHHMCVLWSSDKGSWKMYMDGFPMDSGRNLANGQTIKGGGDFVVGQEQDGLGNGFSPSETFIGKLTQLNVWSKELTVDEIESLRLTCDKKMGDVVAWADLSGKLQGSVSDSAVEFCKDCPIPASIDYGEFEYDGLSPGSVVSYTCMRGFNFAGRSRRQCLVSGEWEFAEPACTRVQCGYPGNIANGWIDGQRFTFDNRIRYSCNKGYKLVGEPTRYCGEFGFWEGDQPKCEKIKCSLPVLSENTLVKNPSPDNKYEPDTDIFFECAPGFQFLTDYDSVYCQRDGTFATSIPSCDPQKCGIPPEIENGQFDNQGNIQEFSVGHIASYVCDYAYELSLDGPTSTTCLPSGEWDTTLPECVVITCPEPSIIANGQYEISGYEFLSQVTYSCNPGYRLSVDTISECLEDGEWFPSAPECQPVRCERPDDILHGSYTGDIFTYKSTVTYQCNLGYKLVGESIRTCQEEGSWSEEVPVCKPVSCGKPDRIEFGTISGRDYTLNNVIRYSCNEGYDLQGSQERVCRETGKWSNNAPSCSRIECDPPPLVAKGFFEGTSYYFGDTIIYQCDEGYFLNGDDTLTCQASRSWVPNPPVCLEILCQVPPNVPNGQFLNPDSLRLFSIGHVVQYECNEGYEMSRVSLNPTGLLECTAAGQWEATLPECVLVRCEQPPVILNGISEITGLEYGSTATYTCIPGFKIQGTASFTCGAEANWIGIENTPVCIAQQCQVPDFVRDGRLDYKSLAVGDVIRYTCNDGFVLEGLEVRRCLVNLSWSGEEPYCRPVDCGDPGDIENGEKELTDTTFQAIVRYQCDVGYLLVGERTRSCGSDRQWSGTAARCEIVHCDKPSRIISNGRMEGDTFTFGSVIEYFCNEGYYIDGISHQRTCLANGQWDLPIPVCSAVECPRLSVKFGQTSGFQTSFGTTLDIDCRLGYRLSGSTSRTCQADGTWSGEETICIKYDCPRPNPPDNGVVLVNDGMASYRCHDGYRLDGPKQRNCLENDTWDLRDPVCLANPCEDIVSAGFPNGDMIYDSLTVGATIIYECHQGYILKGDRKLDCLLDGSWSGSVPFCEKKKCFPPFTPPNSIIVGDDFSFNSVIRYECKEGYRIRGAAERVCQADGSWSGASPKCDFILCPVPQPNRNVIVNGNSYSYGETLEYLCNRGYQLVGPETRTCTESGEWSGEEPSCVSSECPRPAPLNNGVIIASSYTENSRITYSCDEGYRLVGISFRFCLNNLEWSGSDPYCEKVNCPKPPALKNGFHIGDSWYYQDFIEYQCDAGYELRGENRRRCLSVGRWGGADPSCIKTTCGTPRLPDNVLFTLPEGLDTGEYDVTSTLTCAEGFTGIGTNTQTCMANGQWSQTDFYCIKIECIPYTGLQNGRVIGSGISFGTKLKITCDQGYKLIGKSDIECVGSGVWNYEYEPFCERITCPPPQSPSNGNHVMTGDGFVGSVISFTCDEGYRLHGSDRRECQEDETWSGSDASCQHIVCEVPPYVLYALPFDGIAEYYFNSEVTYVCETGYEITAGDAVLTCTYEGYWSGVTPTCSRVTCGEPKSIPNGAINIGGYTYNSNGEYFCDEGYRMKGTAGIYCDETGQWSGNIPSCVPINCGVPHNVENAVYLASEQNLYNSVVTYVCDVGYRLVGQQTTTCLATGVWSGSAPVCEAVSCGLPPEIENAVYEGDRFVYQSTVSYKCIDGYEMSGQPRLECSNSGFWLGERPVCHLVSCGPPPVFDHVTSTMSIGFDLGSIATFVCNDGFYLAGSRTATCRANKKWEYNGPVPSCKIYDCGPPQIVPHGTANNMDTHYNSLVSYSCDEGYKLNGNDTIHCDATGKWKGKIPSCDEITCGDPPKGPNVIASAPSKSYQSIVTYSCESGYKLHGKETLVCEGSGEWSGVSPQCLRISCTPLNLPENGLVLKGDIALSTYSGDEVVFGCQEGYVMVGHSSLQCQDSGIWTADMPSCELAIANSTCPLSTGIPNIRALESQRKVGTSVTLQCSLGYRPSGDMTSTCEEGPRWSVPKGKCSKVFCGKPPLNDFVNVVRIRGASYYYGDKIRYRCRAGVKPSRTPPVITCQDTGKWDGNVACGVTCKRPCQNGGICLGLNRCKCPTGYGGRTCEKAICILPCLNGGYCSAPYFCTCPEGYGGVRCQEAICKKPCKNGGRCLRPNKCKCAHGYKGAFCDRKQY